MDTRIRMEVKKAHAAPGITHIFIWNEQVDQQTKPFIQLGLECLPPNEQQAVDANLAYLREHGYTHFGTISALRKSSDNQFILTLVVKSNRKIVAVIDKLLEELKKSGDIIYSQQNQAVIEKLETYRQTCLEHLGLKPKEAAPRRSKLYADFVKENTQDLEETTNLTFRVAKAKDPTKQKILKEYPSQRTGIDFEVANAMVQRVLLGQKHPKVKAVHGSNGERRGLVSNLLPEFKSFKSIYNERNGHLPSIKPLIKKGFVEGWVSAFTESNDDQHSGNYGLIMSSDTVGFIDDDRLDWNLTSKYAEKDPYCRSIFSKYIPANTFPITEHDILNFPVLTDAKPRHWLGIQERNSHDLFNRTIDIHALAKNPDFIAYKWYQFLKRILVPNKVFEAIAAEAFRSPKQAEKFVANKAARTKKLEEVLLGIPEFRHFVLAHPDMIDRILKEFQESNQDYKKEEDAHLRISLDEVKGKFNALEQIIQGELERQKTCK